VVPGYSTLASPLLQVRYIEIHFRCWANECILCSGMLSPHVC